MKYYLVNSIFLIIWMSVNIAGLLLFAELVLHFTQERIKLGFEGADFGVFLLNDLFSDVPFLHQL